MKSAILHLISLFLILGFAASCGKSASSGGSSGNSSNTLVTSGSAAQTNLVAWYNSTVEGSLPNLATSGLVARMVTKKTRSISTSNGCSAQPVSVFGLNLGSFNICSNSSGSNSYSYPVTGVTLIVSGDKKSGNTDLATAMAAIVTPGAGNLFLTNITQNPSQQSSGSVFVITYINTSSQQVIQVIDTGFNSRLNPVYTADGVNGKETSTYSILPSLSI